MKRKNNLKLIGVLFVLTALFMSNENANAQSEWLDYGNGNSISIEINKPFIARDSLGGSLNPGFSGLSAAIYLTGRYNIYKDLTLVGELPFVNGKLDYGADSLNDLNESGLKIGNPYIGAEYHLPKSPLIFELGLRIPVVSKDPVAGTVVGVRADIDRSEAFIRKIVPVYAAVNFKTVSENNILIKARIGGNLWFNTKVLGFYNQPEFSADYTLQTGYIDKHVNVIFGLTGRYAVDSGPQYTEKYNFVQYGLLITVPYKNIRPGFSIKVPGEDADNLFNYVFGLNFTYGFE